MYKIMIVDDEPWILRGLKKQIEETEFPYLSIRTYEQPLDALISFENDPADLLFVDIRMVGIDGLKFIKRAQEIYADALFVIISAYSDFSYAKDAIRLGVEEYMVKPIVQTELLNVLEKSRQKLNEIRTVRKEENLLQFLRADLNEKPEPEIAGMFGFPNADGVFCCWAYDGYGKAEPFIKMITTQCGENSVCVFPSQGRQFALAVSRHKDAKACELVQEALRAGFVKEGINAGVSGCVTQIRLLPEAILRAQWGALQYFVNPAAGLTVLEAVSPSTGLAEDTGSLLQDANAKQRTELLMRWERQITGNNVPVYQVYYQAYELLRVLHDRAYNPVLDKHMLAFTSPVSMVNHFSTLNKLVTTVAACLTPDGDQEFERVTAEGIGRYIDQNFRKHIRVNTIAEHFHMDAGYTGRLFRKHNKIGITEYITRLRMDYAAKLLKETTLEVSQIAQQCGMNDYFYFTKTFKKLYQVTPTKYRNDNN